MRYDRQFEIRKILKNGKMGVWFKCENGNSLSKTVFTYANINTVSDFIFNGKLEPVKITDLYYQKSCLNDKLSVSFGKLNFYFILCRKQIFKEQKSSFYHKYFWWK